MYVVISIFIRRRRLCIFSFFWKLKIKILLILSEIKTN